MAIVKIHEGTKSETAVDLQDDEGIIFVSPEKARTMRMVPPGCLKDMITMGFARKMWSANYVITSKRLITVPFKPKYQVESFYFKDIASAEMIKPKDASDAAQMAKFCLNMKQGQTSSCQSGGEFWIAMSMSLGNIFKALSAMNADDNARNAAVYGASLRTAQGEDYVYTQASLDKYYAQMAENAKIKAANMASSKVGHSQLRDYFVSVINDCIAEANKD